MDTDWMARPPGRETQQHSEATERAAARGLATPGRALPHLDRIQAAFGRFDVANIVAHTSDEAAASARDIGAAAYATDGHVVLGAAPSLHTVAHEAAHVVQQRAGIACKSEAPGDHFERHADRVADRVVAGESAEAVLAEAVGTGASAAPARGTLQCKILFKGAELPSWGKLSRGKTKNEAALALAEPLLQRAVDEVGSGCTVAKMRTKWNAVVKAEDPVRSRDTRPARRGARSIACSRSRATRATSRGGRARPSASCRIARRPSPRRS